MSEECVLDTNVYLVAAQPKHQYFELSKKAAGFAEAKRLIPLSIKTIENEVRDHIDIIKRNPKLNDKIKEIMVKIIKDFYSLSKELSLNEKIEEIVKDLLQNAIEDRADAEIVATSAFHRKKFLTYDWRTILKQPFEKNIQDVLKKYGLKLDWQNPEDFIRRFRL
ncbi:MAG: hypothetical protein HYW25_04050 [Candidatus Aenigmarchaeota archaeon]|nr:hypothetical protein [Candidatus Aenigmarchaeota archaeon]